VTARRFAATVSYDGARFAGSQRQPQLRTVQEELERAAEALFGAATRVALAGRTDSGVHAEGQVAAFTAETRLDATTVGRALNARLPEDVAVRLVREAPLDFDPRRWARRRWYRYTISCGEARAPLLRRTAWHVRGDLDVERMQQAANEFLGQRDFRACSGPLEPGRNPVRTVTRASWQAQGCLLEFDIEAESFLPQMVRRITGNLVRTGLGAQSIATLVQLLGEAETGTMGPAAPPLGLCLKQVWYEEGYMP
jgi:tRNA pseudouridine38-40 synthase